MIPEYSSGKGGTRKDLGIYVRSSWEANYARYLKWLKDTGNIVRWEYEPKTFEFPVKRGSKFYTPDFLVEELDGSLVWHEVKGYMDQKSRTKLRRMKTHFPLETVIVIDGAAMKEIKAKLSRVIPFWESGRNQKL